MDACLPEVGIPFVVLEGSDTALISTPEEINRSLKRETTSIAVQTDPAESCPDCQLQEEAPNWVDQFFTYSVSQAYRDFEDREKNEPWPNEEANPFAPSSESSGGMVEDQEFSLCSLPDFFGSSATLETFIEESFETELTLSPREE